ncbi:hypothetical protein ACLFLT_21940 [Klebsiella pneumoniae]
MLRKGYKKQCAKTVAASAQPTLALNSVKSKCVVRKGYKKRCKPEASEAEFNDRRRPQGPGAKSAKYRDE